MYNFIEVKSGIQKRLINIKSIEVIYEPLGKDNVEILIKNRHIGVNESYEEIKRKIEEAQFVNIIKEKK